MPYLNTFSLSSNKKVHPQRHVKNNKPIIIYLKRKTAKQYIFYKCDELLYKQNQDYNIFALVAHFPHLQTDRHYKAD